MYFPQESARIFSSSTKLCGCESVVPLFEISPGSVSRLLSLWVLHQPVSKSIELIPLWRRWEPEPWQPSAQISVGRELAGDVRTYTYTHKHTRKLLSQTHTQRTNKSISAYVCCQAVPNPLDPDGYRCSFVGVSFLPRRFQNAAGNIHTRYDSELRCCWLLQR